MNSNRKENYANNKLIKTKMLHDNTDRYVRVY